MLWEKATSFCKAGKNVKIKNTNSAPNNNKFIFTFYFIMLNR